MQVEFKDKRGEMLLVQSINTIGDTFLESIIIHSGKNDEETGTLWDFIEDALSKGITIICREDGYYILSRKVTGSLPHSTYECLSKGKEETTLILELLDKHLGSLRNVKPLEVKPIPDMEGIVKPLEYKPGGKESGIEMVRFH